MIRSLLDFHSKVNFLTVGVKAGLMDRNTWFSVSIFDIENFKKIYIIHMQYAKETLVLILPVEFVIQYFMFYLVLPEFCDKVATDKVQSNI